MNLGAHRRNSLADIFSFALQLAIHLGTQIVDLGLDLVLRWRREALSRLAKRERGEETSHSGTPFD